MNNCKKVLYEELRPEEFIGRINECPIAYLPMGTLEWHGLHLPLGADGIQSRDFFSRLAEQVGGVVLPALFLGPDKNIRTDGKDYYGMDVLSFEEGHPQQLEGSAYWVGDELFLKMLEAVLANLKRAGFKIVLAHGHGPSTTLFSENIPYFKEKFGLKLFNLWNLGDSGDYGMQTDHAAFNESSLVMALRPELADLGRISKEVCPVGVWGTDPRMKASKTTGDEIINRNLYIAIEKLKAELSTLTPVKRSMDYRHVRKLIK